MQTKKRAVRAYVLLNVRAGVLGKRQHART